MGILMTLNKYINVILITMKQTIIDTQNLIKGIVELIKFFKQEWL